eukprot:sb/3461275/
MRRTPFTLSVWTNIWVTSPTFAETIVVHEQYILSGVVERVKVWTDGSGAGSDWYLERITIDIPSLDTISTNPVGIKRTYPCEDWLGKGEGDGTLERTLYAAVEADKSYKQSVRWELTFYTSDILHAGTDAKVWAILYGDKGMSGKVTLGKEQKDKDKFFERGSVDVFTPEVPDIGTELLKLQIGHSGKGRGDGWHCSKVVARCMDGENGTISYTFPCDRWLDREEGDGQLQVDLLPERVVKQSGEGKEEEVEVKNKLTTEQYTVKVHTGDKFGAGTDANCYISVYGTLGDSGERKLMKSENRDKFQRNQVDTFTIDCVELGELYKIVLREDDTNVGADWFVASVSITDSKQKEVVFPCEQWFSKSKADKQIKRTLHPKGMSMEDIDAAQKGAKQGISLAVVDGQTVNENVKEKEEPASTDIKYVVTIETIPRYVVTIETIPRYVVTIETVPRYVVTIETVPRYVVTIETIPRYVVTITEFFPFEIQLWASDRTIFQTILNGKHNGKDQKVHVHCDIAAFSIVPPEREVRRFEISMFSETTFPMSGERKLMKSENRDKFQRNQVDTFTIDCVELGELYKIVLREDDTNVGADWFVASVSITDSKQKEVVFPCEQWFSKSKADKQIKRTLHPKGMSMEDIDAAQKGAKQGISLAVVDGQTVNENVKEKEEPVSTDIKYVVTIETGPDDDMGTDADAYIILKSGTTGATEELSLYHDPEGDEEFEEGMKQEFTVEAPDIGEITSIVVGHNGVLSSEAWYIKCITVLVPTTGARYTFQCERWLAKDRGDRKVVVEFAATAVQDMVAMVPHTLTLATADEENAGTSGDVVIKVFGDKGASEEITLDSKSGTRFVRGMTVTLPVELPDLGAPSRVRVRVSGKDDWLPTQLVLKNMDSLVETVFGNTEWVLKGAAVDITVGEDTTAKTLYKTSVVTSDLFACGTDANVSLILHGDTGDSGTLELKNSAEHTNKFERGHTDTFEFNLLPLGVIRRLRIWHDDKGASSSWHLAKVLVTDTDTGSEFSFPCDKWFSSRKGDKTLSRDLLCENLPEQKEGGESVEEKEQEGYEVIVTISNKKEAGTSHGIWMSLEGAKGTTEKHVIENGAGRFFSKGSSDLFRISNWKDVGSINHLRLGLTPREGADPGKDAIKQCHISQISVNGAGQCICVCLQSLAISPRHTR